jgi:hypothetical protein
LEYVSNVLLLDGGFEKVSNALLLDGVFEDVLMLFFLKLV